MFLYLGAAVSVKKSDIIGIFDIDNVNTQKTTKDFLRGAEKEKKLILAADDLPKSFPDSLPDTQIFQISGKNTGRSFLIITKIISSIPLPTTPSNRDWKAGEQPLRQSFLRGRTP